MTNVELSQEELQLVTSADFILTKNRIIDKVYALFGELSDAFRTRTGTLPPEVLAASPKISKGEQYLQLPWVMLDYPRCFSRNDVLAIRCFFWWGHHFSITLQLQGIWQQRYAAIIGQRLQSTNEWWLGVSADAWQHHFEPGNYQPYRAGTSLEDLPFIKLAKKIPLQQWDQSYDFYTGAFDEILRLLGAEAVE